MTILYDARGHGESTGWEGRGPEAFTWEAMRDDVFDIADAYGLDQFAVGGNSMTTASAVHTATRGSPRVKGLILCRAPAAWEAREARRGDLERKAAAAKEGVRREALRGASSSNLPTREAIAGIAPPPPSLLLSLRGDPVHPVETAEALSVLLPSSELHIFDFEEAIDSDFPLLIREFLRGLDPCP